MDSIKGVVRQICKLLAAQDYQQISMLTAGIRLSEEEIGKAVSAYDRTLIAPPERAFDLLNIIEIKTQKFVGVRQWAVVMPLWTKEEGRSDLSMELTVFESDPVRVELDDIHVL